MPLLACREHGAMDHRICSACRHACLEGRYKTAERCLNCASQRAGVRPAFRTAYHRLRSFAREEKGAAI